MASAPSSTVWFVYLLECENGRLYTGITPDLAERFRKHASGKGAMFTRLNKPLRFIAAKPCVNRSEASRLERVVKGLTREQKRWMAAQWNAADCVHHELSLELIPSRSISCAERA